MRGTVASSHSLNQRYLHTTQYSERCLTKDLNQVHNPQKIKNINPEEQEQMVAEVMKLKVHAVYL